MKLERRTEAPTNTDHRDPLKPRDLSPPDHPPHHLDDPDDPLRGMSDGDVLQRLELM
jgi:hypothetical protein